MKKKIAEILSKLKELYPNPNCELEFNSDYELLVAVILSAQCTDKRVNQVTKELFKDYNTPERMILLSQAELEEKIRSCGFFHNKAKHILSASKEIVEKFNGQIPSKKEELKKLAGVGEKTANVVVSMAFKTPAIAVDTHVFRVSNRLGLASAKDVTKTQHQLEMNVPKEDWINLHYSLVLHGRYVCKAIKPKCEECGLKEVCRFYRETNKIQKSKNK